MIAYEVGDIKIIKDDLSDIFIRSGLNGRIYFISNYKALNMSISFEFDNSHPFNIELKKVINDLDKELKNRTK